MSRNLLSFTQNRFGPNICSTFNNFSWSENTRKETLQIFMYSFIFFYSMNMNCQCVLKYKCPNPSCDFRTEVQIELTWHGRSCKKKPKRANQKKSEERAVEWKLSAAQSFRTAESKNTFLFYVLINHDLSSHCCFESYFIYWFWVENFL